MNSVADLLSCFAHRIAEAFGGEGVRVNVDVQGIVALRAAGLRDDAQVVWIDAELCQSLTYLIYLSLVQHSAPRENRRALPMGKCQFLAREYPGVRVIIRHKHHVRRASSHI